MGGAVFSLLLAAVAVPHVAFTYLREPGTERCPDEQALKAEVSSRLGYDAFTAPPDQTITATISVAGDTLVARLQLSDVAGENLGERRITAQAKDCSELAQALVLALALAIDPLGSSRPTDVRAVPGPRGPPGPAGPPGPPTPSAAAPPPDQVSPVRWNATLGAVGSVAAAPGPAIGVDLAVEAQWARLSLGVEGRADLPSSTTVEGGTVAASLLFVQAVPCFRAGIFGGCALLAVGTERAQGTGFAANYPTNSLFAAAGARALVDVPLFAPVSLRIHADLLAPLVRTSLLVALPPSTVEAWSTPPLSGALGIGLHVRFL